MAPLRPDWSFKRSMAYWEQNFVLTAGIQRDMKVADLGMGIGGPMRRVVEFTGANMTGVTICQHQVNRANQITSTLPEYIQDRTEYLVGDYNDLPSQMKPSSYDAAYFMESLSHSEDRAIPLAQAAKIVKPGGIVAGWQWMLKPAFDYDNPRHMDLKRGMEYGGGSDREQARRRHEEHKGAGLEALQSYDMGSDAIEGGHSVVAFLTRRGPTLKINVLTLGPQAHDGHRENPGDDRRRGAGDAPDGTDARALRLLGGHGRRTGHLHAGLGDDRARPYEQERQGAPEAHRGPAGYY